MKIDFFLPAIACALMACMAAHAHGTKPAQGLPAPVVHQPVQHTQNPALKAIERKIGKEPPYRQKPLYCLVVFGREAKLRVWVVIDGDTVYVDRNGNGDLTEKDEMFKLQRTERGIYGAPCAIGDILDPHTELRHKNFTVEMWGANTYRLSIEASFERKKVPSLSGFANVVFATRPENAPIVHFGGLLRLEPSMATIDDRPAFLCADIGTPGLGDGSFVYYSTDVLQAIDPKLVPQVELEYKDEKGNVIREKAKFYREGIERVYLYPLESGAKDDKRQVKIMLSFPDLWLINVAPVSVTRPIVTLKR